MRLRSHSSVSNPAGLDDGTAGSYAGYHATRIEKTLQLLAALGTRRIVELGGHPWAMTGALLDDPRFEVVAAVSAEDATQWPDDIGVTRRLQSVSTPGKRQAEVVVYVANAERTLFDLAERPDTVLACEIIEHLIRAPHVMLLNANRWLPSGGQLVVTTPNGAQFSNPLRRHSPTPAYRSNVYERHAYLYTLDELVDLVAVCGFRVADAGYWDLCTRRGLPRLYDVLARLPLQYCRDKFKEAIYLVAEKTHTVSQLERLPGVYHSGGSWEHVRNSSWP